MCIYPKVGTLAWHSRDAQFKNMMKKTLACRCACIKYCHRKVKRKQEGFQGPDWRAAKGEGRPQDRKGR